MSIDKPNKKYDHVFAIIRLDLFHDLRTSPETVITVKKVVRTEEEAESEVQRLNELKAERQVRYFWQLTRLERT